MGERNMGIVDFFNEKGGHGCIVPRDSRKGKILFRRSDINDGYSVASGAQVEFTIQANGDGFKAIDITVINGTPAPGRGGGGGGSISSGKRSVGGGSYCFKCGFDGHKQNSCPKGRIEFAEE